MSIDFSNSDMRSWGERMVFEHQNDVPGVSIIGLEFILGFRLGGLDVEVFLSAPSPAEEHHEVDTERHADEQPDHDGEVTVGRSLLTGSCAGLVGGSHGSLG